MARCLLGVIFLLSVRWGVYAFTSGQTVAPDSPPAAAPGGVESVTEALPYIIGGGLAALIVGAGWFFLAGRKAPASVAALEGNPGDPNQPPLYVAPNPLRKLIVPAILLVVFLAAAIPVVTSLLTAAQNVPPPGNPAALSPTIQYQPVYVPTAGQFQTPKINFQPPPPQIKIPQVTPPPVPRVPSVPGFRR
jgi:hypothetical protein